MRSFLISNFLIIGFALGLMAQTESPFANPDNWKKVSTEYFDIYFANNDLEGARQTARFAEIARYEIGTLFDYKPNHKYTLIYSSHPVRLMQSNVRVAPDAKTPSIFRLPKRWAQVVYPGTSEKWFQETKKAVTKLILREFAHGERLGTTIQSQLLFYNAPWFSQGLEEYVAYGWTFEDEMWISSVKGDDLLAMALEGDEFINRVVRKSIWHYIVREYGEQKISEILYLVNISHSVESGIISVLGITLNTLSSRWREYVTTHFAQQQENRISLSQMQEASHIPIKKGYEIIGTAYNDDQDVFALYLNKNGLQTVFLFDEGTNKTRATEIKSGFATNEAVHYRYQAPMAWNHESTTLATTAFQKGKYKLVYYNLDSDDATYVNIPDEIKNITHISWSNDDSRLAISALVGQQVEIYTVSNGKSFRRVTNDQYDDIQPSWSFDDQLIYFSSNRPTITPDSTLIDAFRNTFDLFVLKQGQEDIPDSLAQLTNTPYISETNPIPVSSFELDYISDEVGILNFNQINVFTKAVVPISDLTQGVFSFQASERNITLLAPDKGAYGLYLVSIGAFRPMRDPAPTIYRFELTEKRQKQAKISAMFSPPAKDPLVDSLIQQIENPKVEEVAEDEEEDNQPVRYYIFDEEEEPYEVDRKKKKKKSFVQEQDISAEVSKVFGELPKPNLSSVNVSRSTQTTSTWRTDYIGLGVNFDPIAKMGLDLSAGFSDMMNNHKVEVRVLPFFNLRNTLTEARYTYQKNKIDLFGELGYNSRFFREANAFQTDSLIFRYNHIRVMAGARYPLSSFAAIEAGIGYHFLDRKDLQLLRPDLLNDRDQLVAGRIRFLFNNVKEREGFQYKGMNVNAGFESYYSFKNGDFAFNRARLEATFLHRN